MDTYAKALFLAISAAKALFPVFFERNHFCSITRPNQCFSLRGVVKHIKLRFFAI